jgi:hypothetical protein
MGRPLSEELEVVPFIERSDVILISLSHRWPTLSDTHCLGNKREQMPESKDV